MVKSESFVIKKVGDILNVCSKMVYATWLRFYAGQPVLFQGQI